MSEKFEFNRKFIINTIIDWGGTFLFFLVFNLFIVELSRVPTGSMETDADARGNTIMPGDVLLVSKLHYGAKMPQGFYIPLVSYKIGPFKTAIDRFKLPYLRLPGFSGPKHGDHIVFYFPGEKEEEISMTTEKKQPFIKRLVKANGEETTEIELRDGILYINGEKDSYQDNRVCKYRIEADIPLYSHFFGKMGILMKRVEYISDEKGKVDYQKMYIRMTKKKAEKLEKLHFIKSVDWAMKGTSRYNVSPFVVPYKGYTVMLTELPKDVKAWYFKAIKSFEGNKHVKIEDGVLYINGEEINDYTFKKNYYFGVGDNFLNSKDSFSWGFIPDDHVIGKGVMVIISGKNPKWWWIFNVLTLQVRWSRIFTILV